MSDMNPAGPGPGAGAGASGAVEAARSPYNPADMARMSERGQVSAQQTFGQFMEAAYGIKWDDPLQIATKKMGQKVKSASGLGKAQAIAGGSPAGRRPPPQGRPPQEPGGLDALMGQ